MSQEKEKICEQLSAFLDGELSDEQARQVERAVAEDADLAAELESLRRVRVLLQRLPRLAAPADLSERVLEQAQRNRLLADGSGKGARTVGWWFNRVATAALILIAVGVGSALVAKLSTPSWRDRIGDGSGGGVAEKPGSPGRDVAMKSDAREMKEAAKDLAADYRKSGPPEGSVGPARAEAGARGGAYLRKGGVRDADKDMYRVAGDAIFFELNTVEPELAQVQFEHILQEKYRVEPAVVSDETTAKRAETQVIRGRANYYNQSGVGSDRIVYEVAIPAGDLARFVEDINKLRAAQNVPQIPLHHGQAKDAAGDGKRELAMAEATQVRQGKLAMAEPIQAQPGEPAMTEQAQPMRQLSVPAQAQPRPGAVAGGPGTHAGSAREQTDAMSKVAPCCPATAPAAKPDVATRSTAEGVDAASVPGQVAQVAAPQTAANAAVSGMTQLRVILNVVPSSFRAADAQPAEPAASEPAK